MTRLKLPCVHITSWLTAPRRPSFSDLASPKLWLILLLASVNLPSDAADCTSGEVSPNAAADIITYRIGDGTSADLLANDAHPHGLPLRIDPTAVNLSGCNPGVGCSTMIPGVGTLELDLFGGLGFAPEVDYSGTYTFTYGIIASNGCTDTAAVSISTGSLVVFPYPHGGGSTTPPISFAHNDTVTSDAGKRRLIDIAAELLINDDGTGLTVTGFGVPSAGSLYEINDDLVVFEPPSGSGPFTFTYTVTNGSGETAAATVSVEAQAVTGQPRAFDDQLTAFPAAYTLCLHEGGLLANDQGTGLQITGFGGPFRGTLDPQPTGGWRYLHGGSGGGWDLFEYTVRDDLGATDRATMLIDLPTLANPVTDHHPPVAETDHRTARGGDAVEIAVAELLANDWDPDCESVTFAGSDSTSAGGGSISPLYTGNETVLIYTAPAVADNDIDSFHYTVSDPTGEVASGRVEIALTPTGSPLARLTVTCSSDPTNTTCHFDGSQSMNRYNAPAYPCNLQWDFGDGTTHIPNGSGCVTEIDHTYDTAGVYEATLTVVEPDIGTSHSDRPLTRPGLQGFAAAFTVDCQAGLICTSAASPSILPPGQAVEYRWLFQDSAFNSHNWNTSDPISEITFPHVGLWGARLTLVLTATGDTRQFGWIEQLVTEDPPTAALEIRCSGSTPPFTCILDARESADDHGIIRYRYTYGDSSPAADGSEQQVHSYGAEGNVTASVEVTDNFGQSATASVTFDLPAPIPGINLIGYWDFENPAVLGRDRSGDQRHGAVVGTLPQVAGRCLNHQAVAFDGTSHLRIPNLGFDFNTMEHVTVAAWVRVASHSQPNVFRSQQPISLASDRFQIANYGTGGGWYTVTANPPPPLDQWYHLAGVFDHGDLKIYVDGQLAASSTLPVTQIDATSYAVWAIGARALGTGTQSDSPFVGELDHVEVYNRALSDLEIAQAAGACQ